MRTGRGGPRVTLLEIGLTDPLNPSRNDAPEVYL